MTEQEAVIEKKLIDQLVNGDSQWTYRPDLRTEEQLWNNLKYILEQNNKAKLNDIPLSESEFEQVKNQLSFSSFYMAGKWLVGENGKAYVHVQRGNETLHLLVLNNEHIAGGSSTYEVINQYSALKEEGDDKLQDRDRRFDVSLLINGIPLIHIELKNREHSYYEGLNQISKYISEGKFKGIFSAVQMFVVSNAVDTKYFAAARDTELKANFMTRWLNHNNEPVSDYLDFAKSVLRIPLAHEMVTKYTVLDTQNEKLLLLRPYQIHAIEAMRDASKHSKSGYIWHTTGSGKTMTSYKATRNLLMDIPSIDKTVFLIDRTDLDNQTTSAFQSYAGNDVICVDNTEDVTDLMKKLANNDRQMIVATRQKLQILINKRLVGNEESRQYKSIKSKRVAFVVDECHRAITPQSKRDIENFFYNSLWYGFTGTPIKDENAYETKGDLPTTTATLYGNGEEPLHSYTIKEAIHDNAVLGFMVEYLGSKDKNVDPKVYESEEHMRQVLDIILNHSDQKLGFQYGKGQTYEAILTVKDIPTAQKYYELLTRIKEGKDKLKINDYTLKILPDFPKFAITYSVSENEENSTVNQDKMKKSIDDYNKMFGTNCSIDNIKSYNSNLNDRLARKAERYKTRSQQLDLVIVVKRLLTGFDAPCLSTIFIDKQPMSPQDIIQAFSRTNRLFNAAKTHGQIVTFQSPDEWKDAVKNAVKLYSTPSGAGQPLSEEWDEILQRFIQAVKSLKSYAPLPSNVPGMSLDEKKVFVSIFQEVDKYFAHLKAFTNYDKNNLPEYGITQEEYDDYVAHYNNALKEIRASKENPDDGKDGPVVDMNYELISYGHMKIDYKFILELIQNYISTMDDTSEQEEVDKRLAEIQEYIETLEKENKKLAGLLFSIFEKVKNDKNAYSGQNISEVLENMRHEAIEMVLFSFADKWCCDRENLIFIAHNYRNGVINDLTSLKESANYQAFSEKSEIPMTKLKYKSSLAKELKILLDEEVVPLLRE